MLQSENR